MTLEERAKELRAKQKVIDRAFGQAAREATLRAISAAAERTPPSGGLAGTHTRTGELKQHWAKDSRKRPKKQGEEYVTLLANSKEYASYVNNGHDMDRHFVPGLYVSPASGLLEYDPQRRKEVGLMVGTRTQYVPGLYMTDAAKEAYEEALSGLPQRLKELIE